MVSLFFVMDLFDGFELCVSLLRAFLRGGGATATKDLETSVTRTVTIKKEDRNSPHKITIQTIITMTKRDV
jgi:hypothetical protein